MRIDTVKTQVYKFEELEPEAQQKAIQDHADFTAEVMDLSWVIEDNIYRLEEMGYFDPEINYSGFNSQGDGASFTCKRIDIWQWVKFNKLCKMFRPLKKIVLVHYPL